MNQHTSRRVSPAVAAPTTDSSRNAPDDQPYVTLVDTREHDQQSREAPDFPALPVLEDLL